MRRKARIEFEILKIGIKMMIFGLFSNSLSISKIFEKLQNDLNFGNV